MKLSERDITGISTGKPPCCLFGAIAKVGVTVVHVRPRIENADHGLRLEILGIESHLLEAGTVTEAALIVRRKPAGAAKGGWVSF